MITKRMYYRNEASYQEYFMDVAKAAGLDVPDDVCSREQMRDYALRNREAISSALEERGDRWDEWVGICTVAVAREICYA